MATLGSVLTNLELQHGDEKIQLLKKLEEEGGDTTHTQIPCKTFCLFYPGKEITGLWVNVGKGLQSSHGSMSCSKQEVSHLFISLLLSHGSIQGGGPKRSHDPYPSQPKQLLNIKKYFLGTKTEREMRL